MIKNYSSSLFFVIIFTLLQFYLKSDYLWKYLLANLLSIQVAVLAVNGATLGLTLARLRELSEQNPEFEFENVLHDILFSFKEMIGLMAVALLVGMMSSSAIISIGFFKPYVLESILFAAFGYTIYLLYDFIHGLCVLLGFKG